MEYKPYDYQKNAKEFIIKNSKSVVMLDSGMGKTAIVLDVINQLKFDYFMDIKALIIAPKYVAENIWSAEINKWDTFRNLKYSIVIGNDRAKIKAIRAKADIYITNNETVSWLVEHNFFDFNVVVIDELFHFKNEKSCKFKSLAKAIMHVDRVIGLTSQPIINNISDLWAQIYLFDAGKRLGSTKAGFYERFFFTTRYGNHYIRELKNGASDAIYRAIGDICIRNIEGDKKKKIDCLKRNIYVELNASEMSKYKWLSREMFLDIDDENKIEAKNVSSLCTKLLQVCNGTVYDNKKNVHYVHDRKLKALKSLIDASNGNSVLIVYWFGHDRDRIKKEFPEAKVLESLEDFRNWNQGLIKIGLMNPATGGKNITLHKGGKHIVWYSLTWSLNLYEQMNNRFLNKTDGETIVISHLIAKNTLDEKVIEMLANKKCSQEDLLKALYKKGE